MPIEVHWKCDGCGKAATTTPTEDMSIGVLPLGWYRVYFNSDPDRVTLRESVRRPSMVECSDCLAQSVADTIKTLKPGGRHIITLDPYR